MDTDQTSEDQLSYQFATTLIFTNGRCPFCKGQIYELDNGGLNMKVDINKGREHYPKHKKEYQRNVAILGSLGLTL